MFRLPVARAVVLLLISEACLILAAYVAALSTDTSIDASVYLNYEDGWLQVSIVSAVVLLSMYFMDLYSRFARRSKIETARSIMHAFGIAFLVQALLSYVWAPASLPSNVMIAGSLIAIPAVLIWRFVYTGYLLATVGAESVLFAGTSPAVQEIASEVVSRPELGLRIIGYV
ncbi:MAG TPA: hypothetical protein VEQ63_13715, partial [Bryobacteraceae bacterium]|nr:hypothetical protein [Bryobacteraceae bacterium]